MKARLAGCLLAAWSVAALPGCYSYILPGLDLERMITQTRFQAYRAVAFFADRRAMRPPVKGTVAREAILGQPALTEGDVRGAYVTEVPLPVDEALLQEGRKHFDIVCAACHGLTGDGQSIVSAKMESRKPPSLQSQVVRAFPPGRIFQVVTRGYGYMPGFAAELSVRERWAVVAYLRALQLSRSVPLTALPPDVRRRAKEALHLGQ